MEKWKITKLDPVLQTRTLKATWTYDLETYPYQWEEPKIDISTLTTEEQADLIVKKLREPPKPKSTLESRMADAISDEIDKEILETLKKGIFK